eukprot:TRINITY_DN1030_c0_g1::TRINITY_DN1030_c0_g1_i1::g.30050::m.30050 TRINITY_DN1030_c0_g1::TRINITY_DN1030_c0_g1_i1::g.30050  ORF type:complete len:145 (+),score=10.05,UPF0102/PF02021.12/0.15,CHMI/PF02962.10/0.27 TRINITY_DN1030_c0_g1_i1:24-458(+)
MGGARRRAERLGYRAGGRVTVERGGMMQGGQGVWVAPHRLGSCALPRPLVRSPALPLFHLGNNSLDIAVNTNGKVKVGYIVVQQADKHGQGEMRCLADTQRQVCCVHVRARQGAGQEGHANKDAGGGQLRGWLHWAMVLVLVMC